MKKKIVYLVGFMGAGKTSVGQRLSELLQWPFIDLDQEIETRQGRKIRDIFRSDGEARFRELEREELARVSGQPEAVIALGGGAFVDARNREMVARSGISVWLDASLDTLYPRCAGDLSRPLFASRAKMEHLLESRRAFYCQAEIHIRVDRLGIEEIARQILRELGTGV